MALIAPPAQRDIPLHPVEDAVIKEARRRARRRRFAQGLVLTLLVATGAALIGFRNDPPPPGARAQVGHFDGSRPGGALEGSRLVMEWGAVHEGWVLAYADGRLLWYEDFGPVWERWLTPAGLALARSAAVEWDDFLDGAYSMFPASAWLDPAPREYRPSAYAACLWAGSNPADVSALPAAARSLLDGAVRAPAGHVVSASYEADGWNCLRVSEAELSALRQIAVRDGNWDDGEDFILAASDDGLSSVWAAIWPLMPHGEWIAWGG